MIDKLRCIQEKLKAPKSLYNSFGKYNYRNAETILEAFKPYEEMYRVSLVLSDTIEEIAGRAYVKATATLYDCESDKQVSVTAYAKEADTKKGMDDAQITGATSSYARKYALNGLFLLDDTKDPDSDEYRVQVENKVIKENKFRPDIKSIDANFKALNIEEQKEETLKQFGISSFEELSEKDNQKLYKMFANKRKQMEAEKETQ